MGICEVLTVIFVICKITGYGAPAHWSWWQVLSPEIVAVAIYATIIIGVTWTAFRKEKYGR